jgi:hypothetical protein
MTTVWEQLVKDAEEYLARQAERREQAKRRHPAQGKPKGKETP